MTAFLAGCLVATAMPLAAHAYNHTDTVPPIPLGKLAVACSNIEQDPSRIAAGASASDYWEGRDGHYISDLLVHPESAMEFTANVPDQRNLYVGHAGGTIPYVAIVCYPTSRSNTDPDYALPMTGDLIPHMAQPGAAPKIVSVYEYNFTMTGLALSPPPMQPMKLPAIVYSHGLTGSPISSGYVQVMVQLAAQGFMVTGIFHGDPRFSRVRIQDLSDFVYLLSNFDRVVELMMVRPLSLKAMLDVLLADPGYATGIDSTRIGGFGASMGGAAMTWLAGAWATTTLGGHCDEPVHDPRIRAFMGYVPWAGYSFLPAYCDNQASAAYVDKPYLAISGTADTTAPLTQMKQAVNNFSNTRYMVEWQDGQHELRPEDVDDLFTWMITYFNAYLDVQADPGAFGRFVKMNTVIGGRTDTVTVDVHVPFPDAGFEVTLPELYNPLINHYYIPSDPFDANQVMNDPYAHWIPTGQGFKAWISPVGSDAPASVLPVCRFYAYGRMGSPVSTFYSAFANDCTMLQSPVSGWHYAGTPFYMQPVDASLRCPDGSIGVNRAYNNGAPRMDNNHRYSTSDSTMHEMERQGWSYEATVMCSRK